MSEVQIENGGDIDWWSILSDRTFLENPYPELRRLQALGPVHLDKSVWSAVYTASSQSKPLACGCDCWAV